MAATTLFTAAAPSQVRGLLGFLWLGFCSAGSDWFFLRQHLSSARNGGFSPGRGLLCRAPKGLGLGRERSGKVVAMATSIPADRVPDMGKRQLMNLLLLGAISLPATGMLVPYAAFFAPPG